MYNNILHATDLHENHFQISVRAATIAKQFNAKLFLIHVIELPKSVQIAQGLGFTELAQPSKEDALTVMKLLGEALSIPQKQQFVEIGSISEQIFKKAGEIESNLLIIGNHHIEGISSLLGSTAHDILRHAPCDVITLMAG